MRVSKKSQILVCTCVQGGELLEWLCVSGRIDVVMCFATVNGSVNGCMAVCLTFFDSQLPRLPH